MFITSDLYASHHHLWQPAFLKEAFELFWRDGDAGCVFLIGA